MRQAFMRLPGPMPVKAVTALVLVAVLLVVLNFVYTWMGEVFLDSGGGVG